MLYIKLFVIVNMFVYPPRKNNKPVYTEITCNAVTEKCSGSEVSRNDTYWSGLYKKVDKMYDNETKTLPVGTLLYRGTLQERPYNFKSNTGSPLIYFGLDFVISTWISLETHDHIQKNNRIKIKNRTYYLHVYKTKKPIKYRYIPDDKGTIMDFDKTSALKYPCIHPQEILHGDNDFNSRYSELGTELSFPRNDKYSSMRDIVEHVDTYVVDVHKLQTHFKKHISEWDPVHALKKIKV